MSQTALNAAIRDALNMPLQDGDTTGSATKNRQAAAIAAAIDAYVVAKLTTLKASLTVPGAFVGTGGGPAPVVVNPAGISGYDPSR